MSIKKGSAGADQAGQELSQTVLNQTEMSFRAYDSCFGCATHARPGHQPLQVRVFDQDRQLVREVFR